MNCEPKVPLVFGRLNDDSLTIKKKESEELFLIFFFFLFFFEFSGGTQNLFSEIKTISINQSLLLELSFLRTLFTFNSTFRLLTTIDFFSFYYQYLPFALNSTLRHYSYEYISFIGCWCYRRAHKTSNFYYSAHVYFDPSINQTNKQLNYRALCLLYMHARSRCLDNKQKMVKMFYKEMVMESESIKDFNQN